MVLSTFEGDESSAKARSGGGSDAVVLSLADSDPEWAHDFANGNASTIPAQAIIGYLGDVRVIVDTNTLRWRASNTQSLGASEAHPSNSDSENLSLLITAATSAARAIQRIRTDALSVPVLAHLSSWGYE